MSSKTGIFLILFTILASNFIAVPTFAQNDYTVLAPLPGTTIKDNCVAGDKDCKTNLEKYLPGAFKLAVGLSAAFAVFMIVIGGFQYMSTDALQGKEEGKARIWNSVKGLVLVIGAWLILYTINPGLLELRLSIETIEIKGPPSSANGGVLGAGGTTPGRAMTPEEEAESNRIKKLLEGPNPNQKIVGTYSDACTKGQATGCVNLNGLQQTTIEGVLALRRDFGQFINITGGTELSIHSPTGNHPKGNALDFGQGNNPNYQALTNWIISRGGTPAVNNRGESVYTIQINNRPVRFTKESDHWHVTF